MPIIGSVQSLSRVQLLAYPWAAALQASLSITNSWNLLKLMSIESVMPSNYLILCRPLLLLPSIFPSIRDFSKACHVCKSSKRSLSALLIPMSLLTPSSPKVYLLVIHFQKSIPLTTADFRSSEHSQLGLFILLLVINNLTECKLQTCLLSHHNKMRLGKATFSSCLSRDKTRNPGLPSEHQTCLSC